MRNIIKQLAIVLVLILFLICPYLIFNEYANAESKVPTMGEELDKLGKSSGYERNVSETTVSQIAGKVVSVLLSLLGIIFIALMIYGGYLWMTDRGNEDNVRRAKSLIVNAVIGLIVIAASYAVSYFIFSKIVNGRITSPDNSSQIDSGSQINSGSGAATHEGE